MKHSDVVKPPAFRRVLSGNDAARVPYHQKALAHRYGLVTVFPLSMSKNQSSLNGSRSSSIVIVTNIYLMR